MKGKVALETATEISPLSVLVRGVLEWAFPGRTLSQLFEQHAPGHQTRRLAMESVFFLLLQVVTGSLRSVFAPFQADGTGPAPAIDASFQALYGKVGRTAPAFAAALVRSSAERLLPLMRQAKAVVPGWRGYEVRIWDGTDLDGSEHR